MRLRSAVLFAALGASAVMLRSEPGMSISLAGTWAVKLDPSKLGGAQNWASQGLASSESMFLPGSTDQAALGTRTTGAERDRLSRPFTYEGPVWYQRDVFVPESWRGKRITLFLERTHWQTEVWVDGKPFGLQDSLSTPHVYDLSGPLTPGKHVVTLCVDNSYKIDVGRRAHSVTDWTQTNWNGVAGRIELRASDPVWIDSVQVSVMPDGGVRVEADTGNITGQAIDGELRVSVAGKAATGRVTGPKATVLVPGPFATWNEHHPELHDVELTLSAGPFRDQLKTRVGLRTIAIRGTQFVLNGRPVFLRGTVECAIFPKTGYPPLDVESWARLFRIARSYGLNHFRFHSWCPPEAAFVAADAAGFLLQVELPVWSNRAGRDPKLNEYMRAEGQRILKAYGNHPSFTMLCLGNELTGDFAFMDQLVAEFKASDPRRLYTFSSDHVRRVEGLTSDYYVTHNISAGRLRIHGTRFTKTDSGTDADFSNLVKNVKVPLVAHEIGQWVTHPDYSEIAKYDGVLKARNLEVFRDRLGQRGMLDQARVFQKATGRFAWEVYKEDLETALRTPRFGGFQMLQLYDFPGQGEALIGLLDAFWESKGILSPEEVRRFCNDTVPLARMKKFVWTNDETFVATAQVAHYGEKPLAHAAGTWYVRDAGGREVLSGRLPPADVPSGSVTTLGEIRVPLSGIGQAARLKLTLTAAGAENSWDLWVYPKQARPITAAGVTVTDRLDAAAIKSLDEGGRVVLLWPAKASNEHVLATQFLPVFWSLSFFPKQSGVMSILCDPGHPALAGFPTEMHSQWQWRELMEEGRALILDDAPGGYRPLVQVIDDYHRGHKLGAVFEARVGKGRLLVSMLDLENELQARPVAQQLRSSLMRYAASDRFEPKQELPAALLRTLLKDDQ